MTGKLNLPLDRCESEIIDGDKLRLQLEHDFQASNNRIDIISAYVTQTAVDWLSNWISKDIQVTLVCRLSPKDVIDGSTQLSALNAALKAGYDVRCLHSLHAKIYSIDCKKIYIGSANLTNNGFKIYGEGNLEACTTVSATDNNLNFIDNIISSSIKLDIDTLIRMQACIDTQEAKHLFNEWPEGVIEETKDVWVRDFFWATPDHSFINADVIHDLGLLGLDGLQLFSKEHVLNCRCVKWLISKLKDAPEKELYYGFLTKQLHDDLMDDPEPYRRDVKNLLSNLLAYVEKYLEDTIEISRPSHSQRIKLLVTS